MVISLSPHVQPTTIETYLLLENAYYTAIIKTSFITRYPHYSLPFLIRLQYKVTLSLALLFTKLQFRPMDGPLPSGEEYDQALLCMQQTGEQSFSSAVEALQRHHYDLPTAMAERQRRNAAVAINREEEEGEDDEAETIRRYFQFLESKRRRRGGGLLGLLFCGVRWLFGSLFRGVASLVLPQSFFLRIFYPPFHSLYFQQLLLPIQKPPLKALLLNTRHLRRKSVLVAVSGAVVSPALVDVLNSPPISEAIAMWFSFTGYTLGDRQLAILGRDINRPQIILCRMDACEEIVIIARFFEEDFVNVTPQVLKTGYEKGVEQMERDRKIRKLYSTYMLVMHHKVAISDHQDEDEDEEEEERYRPLPVDPEIAAQNQAYHELQAREEMSRLRNQDEEKQQRQKREEQEQGAQLRRIRMQSIPPQPKSGNIVRVSFRCPNGMTLVRNFPLDQKLELIYNWVEVNDEIEFQSPSRSFELLHSYPLRGLTSDREKLIGEVFDDKQEKIVIREM